MFFFLKDSIWDFIQGINWLNPTINTFFNNLVPDQHLNKSSFWIYKRFNMDLSIGRIN